MVTITDKAGATSAHWEVVDSSKTGKDIFPYDQNCPIGYDRVRVLRQIVDVYSIMTNCKKQEWQTQGSVFLLS